MPHLPLRAALAWVLVGASPAAWAQAVELRDFSVERFRLALDREGLLGLEWADVPEDVSWDLALWVGHADAPLAIYSEQNGARTRAGELVASRTGGSLALAVSLYGRFELAFEVPFVLQQSRPEMLAGIAGPLGALSDFGLGAPRIVPKIQIVKQRDVGIALAVAPGVVLPSSRRGEYFGQEKLIFEPELLISREVGALRLAGSVGYRLRSATSIANLEIGNELFGAVGAGFRFASIGGPPLELDVTIAAATSDQSPFDRANQRYVELLGGASVRIVPGLVAFAAAGVGLSPGFGTPDWRVLGGLRLFGPTAEPAPGPSKLEVLDPDDDGDGLTNAHDRCPSEPGPREGEGCPDADRDGDGVVDRLDICPDLAEDLDGFEDEDGCPEPDDDGDGLVDGADACPRDAGPVANRGCPEPDRDGDGVPDRIDNCPNAKGERRNRGCKEPQLVALGRHALRLSAPIQFDTASDRIDPASYALLDQVALVLIAHPELGKIRIEGHTDDRGTSRTNLRLSQRRAEAVRRYLMLQLVEPKRLEAVGIGEARPLETNHTKDGRAANRRVELHFNRAR